VAALERKLEEQMRGEKKRVEEVYGEGMADQGRKSLLIVEKIRERNEGKERKLSWELEEKKRKNQKEERSRDGIAVKDRLTRESSATMKRLPAKIRPYFRSHLRDRSPVVRTIMKSGMQREETVTRRPVLTVRKANDNRRRRARTSSTGCPDAHITDYCLRAPGAEKIDVFKF
jgi:hypothetical protein